MTGGWGDLLLKVDGIGYQVFLSPPALTPLLLAGRRPNRYTLACPLVLATPGPAPPIPRPPLPGPEVKPGDWDSLPPGSI